MLFIKKPRRIAAMLFMTSDVWASASYTTGKC